MSYDAAVAHLRTLLERGAVGDFDAALDALHVARVLDDDDWARWYSLRASGGPLPWPVADAGPEPEPEYRRGTAQRVIVASEPVRHDGVDVFAVVVRTQSTDVCFFGDWVAPPALSDELGTRYEPDPDWADESQVWRYQPPAPAAAVRFSVLEK